MDFSLSSQKTPDLRLQDEYLQVFTPNRSWDDAFVSHIHIYCLEEFTVFVETTDISVYLYTTVMLSV
jgi:hypothetical protein